MSADRGPADARRSRDRAQHGSSNGFRIHRMTANRWDLVRTPEGWRIKHRTLRQLDGSEPARAILRQAIAR
ncbi:MAG TPA: nuclear transport factor 2 family protein [Xanthobacteraceae bacterium]